ncbi:Integrase [Candidatus Phaeomarinobacter ectocarpi]|uniref:Integrase n=1 Tax=Candidatus Phaeomarinibacter ectocarpi TaxID=1458461 RepID=X5MFY8_9HYPH|nr:site-specific integrase [Candidatus Phaeomarinobacter ectocarpi]CDO60274.1 Integrase [Candidatus Phaeomarinobacter ectocarpi]
MSRRFQKLTRQRMRALEAGKSLSEHGITFRRLPDGDGVYSVNIMVDRKRIHRSLGRESDGVTRSTAETFISNLRADARAGRLNLPKGRKISLTMRDAAPRYIDRLTEEGGKEIARKARRLDMALVPFLGDKPLEQISTFDVERYKKQRLSTPIVSRKKLKGGETLPNNTPATVNRELATLSHLIHKAEEWGWISKRQAKINRLPEDNGRITYLTAEQADALLEASKADQNIQIYPFILIGLRTSMRKSEILSIRRDNVDLTKNSIYLPNAKAGARTQPMPTSLAAYLARHIGTLPPGTPWLFPSPGAAGGHTTDVRKAFRRCVERAGLDPEQVVIHTLRHTAITHLVQAGVDLPTVKRISGHKTMIMVERYAHQSGAHIAAAMDKLDERFKKNSA